MASAQTHDCPATGCTRHIGARQLACRPHWFMIPPDLRDAVWSAWRNGLGKGSPEHADAVAAAVAALNDKIRARQEEN